MWLHISAVIVILGCVFQTYIFMQAKRLYTKGVASHNTAIYQLLCEKFIRVYESGISHELTEFANEVYAFLASKETTPFTPKTDPRQSIGTAESRPGSCRTG